MLEVLFKIWFHIFTNYCLLCQPTSLLYRTNHRDKNLNLKRSLYILNHDDNLTTDVITKQNTINKLFTKIIIILLIFTGFAILITIIIGLIFLYINCSRPSRIHKQIRIEYLDSNEINNYSDNTLTSSKSEQSSFQDI
ncbi:unnamed protein product [Adineta steineri]|nr:unnamed protein product [Adineta steineri]CAF3748207.1 unnamed protein product [Adineta steineri]